MPRLAGPRRLARLILRQSSVLFLAAGQYSSVVYGLVVLPLAARTFSASTLGVYVFIQSIANLLVQLSDFGLTTYGQRELANAHRTKASESYIVLSVLVARLCVFSLVLGGVMSALQFTSLGAEFGILEFGVLIFLGIGAAINLSWYFEFKSRYKLSSLLAVVPRVLALTAFLAIVRSEQDYALGIIIWAAPQIISGVVVFGLCIRELDCREGLRAAKHVLSALRRSLPIFLASLNQAVMANLGYWILATQGSPVAVGDFGIADRVFRALRSLLHPFLVFNQQRVIAEYCSSQWARAIGDRTWLILVVTVFGALAMIMAAPNMLRLVNPDASTDAILTLRILLAVLFFAVWTANVGQIALTMSGRGWLVFLTGGCAALVACAIAVAFPTASGVARGILIGELLFLLGMMGCCISIKAPLRQLLFGSR